MVDVRNMKRGEKLKVVDSFSREMYENQSKFDDAVANYSHLLGREVEFVEVYHKYSDPRFDLVKVKGTNLHLYAVELEFPDCAAELNPCDLSALSQLLTAVV